MKAIYCRRANLGSLLLRLGMNSPWSHCGIVTPDQTVIEAAAFHGVREVATIDFMRECSEFRVKDIWVPDDKAALDFARSQLGRRYDWGGAFGIAFADRRWQEPDAWFCSELVEAAIAAGQRRRFEHDAWRVTPQHSWMVQ